MRKGMRGWGAAIATLIAPLTASAQLTPPPPGTPVAPLAVPQHVVMPPTAPPNTAPIAAPAAAPAAAPIAAPIGEKPQGRKLLNTTNAQIDYRIDTVGPSGVGRVDVYMTPDRGQTWVKVGEDTDKQSPANVNLPGEGLFGIRLAITNGNGFGGRAPKSGDRPQFYVEVDATSPTVVIQPYEMVPNAGAIDLKWTAMDGNLAPEPVSLFYRGRPDSQWLPIAQNIKNEGSHRWLFPANVPPQIYLKLEVIDLAGNITKVETPSPILLDQTEPEATLVDVTGINRQAPAPVTPVSLPSAAPTVIPIPPTMPASLPVLPPAPGVR